MQRTKQKRLQAEYICIEFASTSSGQARFGLVARSTVEAEGPLGPFLQRIGAVRFQRFSLSASLFCINALFMAIWKIANVSDSKCLYTPKYFGSDSLAWIAATVSRK